MGLAVGLSLVLPAMGWAKADSASSYLGRPLVDVLQEFQEKGLNLIFTSAVVRDDLLVNVEPSSHEMRAILAEILPPLGLKARPGPGETLLIVSLTAAGDKGTITGRVLSAVRSLPAAGATVRLAGTDMQVEPREDGSFTLSHIPAGRYTLEVEAPGFLTASVPRVRVVAGKPVEILIHLRGCPSFVEEIIVTPGRHSIVQQEASGQRVIHDADALLVPAQGNDMSRVIQLLPGIAATDSTAALHVRGSDTQDVALVLDGLELYEPFHVEAYQSPFSFVDSTIVQRTEFLAGGFTADLGDRNGGVIRMTTAGLEHGFSSEIAVGTLNSRFSHSAPLSGTKGSWLVSARTWYPEAVWESIDFGEEDLDPRFSDLYFKVSVNVSPQTIISTHGLLAHDELDFTEPEQIEHVENSNTSGYLWVRGLHTWSGDLFSDTVLSGGRIHRSRRGVAEPDDIQVRVTDDRDVTFLGLRHDMSWQASDRQLLKFGFDMRRLLAEYDYSNIEEETGTPRSDLLLRPGGNSFAVYIAYRAGLGHNFATEVGLRWDSQTYIGDSQISPRLNGIWRLGERSELRLGLGDSYQSQRINELQVEDGVTDFVPAELSRQVDLTFQHGFQGGLSFRADIYYRRLTDVQPHYENNLDKLELFPEAEPDRVL
ncbi:MAG: TonB-dependent receptor, partial [Acidobacteria bacterium]|nr:TonB-dependent receptor [Acidobacteriota bacterium]